MRTYESHMRVCAREWEVGQWPRWVGGQSERFGNGSSCWRWRWGFRRPWRVRGTNHDNLTSLYLTGRFSITLVQKSHNKPVFASLSNGELIGKILKALWAADIWLEDRSHSPDSEANIEIDCLSLFIRAIWWHRWGDIWIDGTLHSWRQSMSGSPISQTSSYILAKPTWSSFMESPPPLTLLRTAHVCEHLIDYNSDIFTCPSALLSAKFLDGKRGGMSQKAHRLLILHLAAPWLQTYGLTTMLPSMAVFCPPPNLCAINHNASTVTKRVTLHTHARLKEDVAVVEGLWDYIITWIKFYYLLPSLLLLIYIPEPITGAFWPILKSSDLLIFYPNLLCTAVPASLFAWRFNV